MNYSLFKFLDDADLAERVLKLERKCEELRQANTAIAASLLKQFIEALAAARAELDRRTHGS